VVKKKGGAHGKTAAQKNKGRKVVSKIRRGKNFLSRGLTKIFARPATISEKEKEHEYRYETLGP